MRLACTEMLRAELSRQAPTGSATGLLSYLNYSAHHLAIEFTWVDVSPLLNCELHYGSSCVFFINVSLAT